jgi:hypothetical protein
MSDRDSLLERLLSGETNAADPAVQRLFERDPAARAEYEALRALESSLERQGDRAREVVAAAQKLPDRVGAQQVLTTLTKLAGERPGTAAAPATPRPQTASSKRLAPVWLALAAALVAALAWGWWIRSQKATPEKEILLDTPSGITELVLVSPVGAVKQYLPFQWTGELDPGGWFEVKVYDADRPGSEPIAQSGTVMASQWSPDSGRAPSTWPGRISWSVTRYDGAGLFHTKSAMASLLP